MDWLSLPIVFAYLVGVNALTAFRFGEDKWRAREGKRRVSEADLLGLALIGGTPGAYLARHLFRHKTRKQPFGNRLFGIFVLQACALATWIVIRI